METKLAKVVEKKKLENPIENNPQSLVEMAIKGGLPIEHLEKLVALNERFLADKSRKSFLVALSKFQSECPVLEKTKTVAFGNTKYKYAPLGEIATVIKLAMNNNELAYRWEIDDTTDKIRCTCIISHTDGHCEKTTMSAMKDNSGSKNEIQQRGSTITYLQRYTLISALGIPTADEDVDGRTESPEPEKVKIHIPAGELMEKKGMDKPVDPLTQLLDNQQPGGVPQPNPQEKNIDDFIGGRDKRTDDSERLLQLTIAVDELCDGSKTVKNRYIFDMKNMVGIDPTKKYTELTEPEYQRLMDKLNEIRGKIPNQGKKPTTGTR